MRVTVSLDILNNVIKYLEQMPYAQVHPLMKALLEDVTGQTVSEQKQLEEEKDDAPTD